MKVWLKAVGKNLSYMMRRLGRVEHVLCPPGSIEANIRGLPPNDLIIYNKYMHRFREWMNGREGEKLYLDILAYVAGESVADPMPTLPYYVHDKIYPQDRYELSAEENYNNLLRRLK